MKKNNLLTLAACACAFLLSACSNEIDTAGSPDRAGAGEAIVTVSLQFPQADKPAGYAPGDLGDDVLPGVALDAEKEIKSIAFIAFTPGGTGVYLSENPTLTDNGFTKPLTPKDEAVPGEYTATFKIKSGDFDGNTTIIAIANYKENGLTFGADPSLDAVKKMLSVALAEEADKDFIDYPLLMTASYEDEITEGATVPITFDMERILARVDVVNNAYDQTTKENDFVLTSAQLISAPTQGTMIAGQTGVVPSGYIKLKVQDDVKEILPADGQPVSPTNPAKQQLAPMYVYENSNTDKDDATKLSATATHVLVKGTYKGKAYDKTIEFRTLEKVEAGVKVGGEIVPIARNTRYVVEISSGTEGEPVFNVTVTDWAKGDRLEVAIDFAEPVLEGLDQIPPVTSGATWDAATKTLNITDATAPVELSFRVRGFQDSDFTMVAEYDENTSPLAKAIQVKRSEPALTGYADAPVGDKDEAPLARTYTVTIPKYTEECPSLTKMIVYNAAYADAQTEITVKYAPVFIGDIKSQGAAINHVTKLVDLKSLANGQAGTISFFASANTTLDNSTVVNKGLTNNFYTITNPGVEETDLATIKKYGPGKRVTLIYQGLTDNPELGEVIVKETGADASTAKKLFVKSFKKAYFESVAFSPNAANTLVEGKNLYLAVNNGDHGTIDYTVYDDAVKNPFTPVASANYATAGTNPSWVQNGINSATVGDNLGVVSAEFLIVKRVIKVLLPKAIPNPARALNLRVGLLGEPGDIALTPVYPSAYNSADGTYGPITAADKAFRPVLVKTVWFAPINIGQAKISDRNDPSTAGGFLFQWGRKQALWWNSPSAYGPVDSAAAAGTNFIVNNAAPNDWLNLQNSKLWNSGSDSYPKKTNNDPCPEGWRVPSVDEWSRSIVGGGSPLHVWQGATSPGAAQNGLITVTGTESTMLYLAASGCRNSDGGPNGVGTNGYIWASATSGGNGAIVLYNSARVSETSIYRASGLPVRCVQDL